jgi:hypothetical protein
MIDKEIITKWSGIPNPRDSLDILPVGSIRVSSKPLEEGMRET